MKRIRLNEEKFFVVDDMDCARVIAAGPWRLSHDHNSNFYAVRCGPNVNGKRTTLSAHRFILGLTDPKLNVDHKDGDGLNNRRENLRIATTQQNIQNSRPHKDAKSKYKGVSWRKARNCWIAKILANNKRVHLGSFKKEEEAARAYDQAARMYFGEFAYTNFAGNWRPK